MVKKNHTGCTSKFLDEFYTLRIIDFTDLFVIVKVRNPRRAVEELETGVVKCVQVLLLANVLHLNMMLVCHGVLVISTSLGVPVGFVVGWGTIWRWGLVYDFGSEDVVRDRWGGSRHCRGVELVRLVAIEVHQMFSAFIHSEGAAKITSNSPISVIFP